jgi:hypothetical protein
VPEEFLLFFAYRKGSNFFIYNPTEPGASLMPLHVRTSYRYSGKPACFQTPVQKLFDFYKKEKA